MILALILRMVEVGVDVESKNQITSSLKSFEAQIPRRCMTGKVHKETIRNTKFVSFLFLFSLFVCSLFFIPYFFSLV